MKVDSSEDLGKSKYFDVTEEEDEDEEYFPIKSMEIENEWINNDSEIMKESKGTISPYFGNAQKNSSSENIRFISPIQEKRETETNSSCNANTPKINRSILNELLPTQVQLESNNSESEFYFFNDKIYGILFKGCCIVWALWSFLLINSKSMTSPTERLYEITGWFVCLLLVGLAMTAIWAKLLAEQTEAVVYGLMITLPVGFGFLGLTAFSHWYILSGLVSVVISAILSLTIYLNRQNLKNTVEIVHNAAIFIQATPKVYSLLLKIVSLYVVFVIVWLMAFVRLFSSSNSLISTIISQIFFIFTLIWFGAVLSTSQKFIIATWVRSWMDQTEDLESSDSNRNTRTFFNDETFGTICLAAGLLSLAKITRIVGKGVHLSGKVISQTIPFSGILSNFFSWIVSLISIAERFMQRFTDFSIYFLAISDDFNFNFIDSCRQMSQVLSGHVGLAVTTDTTAQLLLTFSTVLISFISTVLILFIAKSHVAWSSGVLIGLLAAAVTGFISNVYTSAIDATFLCYVMDLKRPERLGLIKNEIQDAFSTKLSAV